ncbi:MAG: 50S ribosomal protein L9 [bacterium]
MKVILTEDIRNLGPAGEVIEVKDGYARNYLIPKNLAVKASKANLSRVDQIKTTRANREERRKKKLATLAESLEGLSIDIPVQVGDDEKIYGAVTQHMVLEALRGRGFNLERKAVQLEEPIKQLGVYNIEIKLHAEVRPQIRIWVVSV